MGTNYQLNDFMYYTNIAFKVAAVPTITWNKQQSSNNPQYESVKRFFTKAWFISSAVAVVYQNIGMLIYLLAPQGANLYTAANIEPEYQTDVIILIAETGSIMGITIVSSSKMISLLWHGKRISKLLGKMQEIFPSDHLKSDDSSLYRVQYFAKYSHTLMKYTTAFFLFAFYYYNFSPFFLMANELVSGGKHIRYHYQSNTWYPWQTKENSRSLWQYTITYLFQLQSAVAIVSFTTASEFMLCFLVTQMQMHFDYLCNALMNLDASSRNANEHLKYLIAYHINLLSLSKEINIIFNISFLVNFITSSISICLMGISMIMISLLNTVKYSVGLSFFLSLNLFICYNGSKYTEASDKLMSAAFYNNWFEGDLSYRRMIYFFMMRSSEPNILRAYKFAAVSMSTFMVILQFSYKLFACVRATD